MHLLAGVALTITVTALTGVLVSRDNSGNRPPGVHAQRYCWPKYPRPNEGEAARQCIVANTRLLELAQREIHKGSDIRMGRDS